jgi:type I restriction enzyme S subunit
MEYNLTLADAVVSANTGLDAIKRAPIVEENTGIKCLRIQDVNQEKDFVNWGNTLVEKRNFEKFQLKESDILIARTGGSVGSNRYIYQGLPAVYNNGLIRIRVNTEKHNPKFIYYLLQTKQFESHINSIAYSTSAQPNMKIRDFLRFEFKELGLDIENAVEEILSNMDAKIELNKQTNQTLEQMAQALFKSWFVDFDPVIDNALAADNHIPDELQERAELRQRVIAVRATNPKLKPLPDDIQQLFPSEFEESGDPTVGISGWIPKGWKLSTIGEVCSHIIDHRGKTPKKLGGDWSHSGIAAISAKNIKNNSLVRADTIRYVNDELYRKWMKEPLKPKDILMTSEAPMGEMYFLAEKSNYLLSQRLYGMRADKDKTTGEYLFQWLQSDKAKSDLDGRSTGTTVVGIRQVELKKVAVLLSDLAIVKIFSDLAGQYLLQKDRNEVQIISLEKLRDTLLPKLISGEITLSKAKVSMEA